MKTDLRIVAGSLLVVGLEGTEMTALERAWLKLIRPAGVILFRRNIADAKQTRALLAEATGFCARNSARFVDLEGGTVDRLRDVLAPIPPVAAVVRAARISGRPAFASEHGALIARAVRAFGFNSPLSPVFDLGLPESRKVMETRCAGATAAEVVAYARPFLTELAAEGVAGCGKHFPGLGGGTLDSHLETPRIRRKWKLLWEEDLEPYRALRNELPMVMVNHAAYPLTTDPKRPASVSGFWIGDVLRRRIGYRGIVLSDDLEMGGVANFMPIPEAAIDAVRVGSEMLLICHHPEPILGVYESLITESERSGAFRRILLARARESERKRQRVFAAGMPNALDQSQFEALRTQILQFTAAVEKAAQSPEAATE